MLGAAAIATSLLAGCASGPVSVRGPAAGPPDEAYACAMRELNERDFTVVAADRAAGFIRAERFRWNVVPAMTGAARYDILTVSLYEDDGGHVLRVTAALTERRPPPDEDDDPPDPIVVRPSDRARADAAALLERCTAAP